MNANILKSIAVLSLTIASITINISPTIFACEIKDQDIKPTSWEHAQRLYGDGYSIIGTLTKRIDIPRDEDVANINSLPLIADSCKVRMQAANNTTPRKLSKNRQISFDLSFIGGDFASNHFLKVKNDSWIPFDNSNIFQFEHHYSKDFSVLSNFARFEAACAMTIKAICKEITLEANNAVETDPKLRDESENNTQDDDNVSV